LTDSNREPNEVRCVLGLAVTSPAEVVLQVAAAGPDQLVLEELFSASLDGELIPYEELPGAAGGRQHVLRADPGKLLVVYDAKVARAPVGDAQVVSLRDRVDALRPSRYCPSDRLSGFAGSRFGQEPTALDKVRAICAYVNRHIRYVSGSSIGTTDAVDTLVAGQGVCRDFAHLVAALCRAVDVPARVTGVYAPGLMPMDLHAVVETDIDGRWLVWDATRLAPRPSLVRIATGRDAADTAFATVLSGHAELTTLQVLAVAGGRLPTDDHVGLVTLD
jgi:transglutaminase-like putative cysteine protease